MSQDFEAIIEELTENNPRYHEDAYEFVMEALQYTQKKFKSVAHVSGEEMLEGMRDLLLKQYGPMARTVLQYWGIKGTEDFGQIVFDLVERKVLSKTEKDSIDSFRNAYDFAEVFDNGYRKELAKKIKKMRSI